MKFKNSAPKSALGFQGLLGAIFRCEMIGVCGRLTLAMTLPPDPILVRFRAALAETYGDRLSRAVLFGSRARGDAHPDSDYDIAVFLRDIPDRFEEMNRLADLGTAILYETGCVIHALPYQATTYNDPRMPLMHEIRAEGLDL